MDIRDRIDKFVSTLPDVVACKAYGSSIGYQSGYSKDEKKQVDLIVVVEDIKKFYKDNLKKNSYMYKLTSKLYFNLASRKALRSAAGICYTTHIDYEGDTYKMGVIEKKDVLDDLLNWRTYYIAGRFQKEMYTVISDKEIEKAILVNRNNAVTIASIVLEKENPDIVDFYESLCSLSYLGDSRESLKAEDPHKVRKLAEGSKKYFDEVYLKDSKVIKVENKVVKIDYKKVKDNIKLLPDDLKNRLLPFLKGDLENNLEPLRKEIKSYLTEVVSSSSKGQTLKGIMTTGIINSINYAFEKLKKGRKK